MHVHITLQRLEEKQAFLARTVRLKIVLNLFYMSRLHKYNNINLGISINVTYSFSTTLLHLPSNFPLVYMTFVCIFTFHN